MGLSSSQARLLTLTSRMHDIEYKAAKLEAQKLQMANESRRAYEDYLIALDATKIQKKTIDTDGSIKYIDATYQNLVDDGYKISFVGFGYGLEHGVYENFVNATHDKTSFNAGNREYFAALQTGHATALDLIECQSGSVYEVYTAQQLVSALSSHNTGSTIRLMHDIEIEDDSSRVVSNLTNCTFDGNGHTITGLTKSMFNEIRNSNIKNLRLNGNINTTDEFVGILGRKLFSGNITNVAVSGSVTNTSATGNYIGGLVGIIYGTGASTVEQCSSSANIEGQKIIGGLVGQCGYGSTGADIYVKNCSSSGSVNGDSYVGGLIGMVRTDSSKHTYIEHCSSSSDVYASKLVFLRDKDKGGYCSIAGGLIGDLHNNADVLNSKATGNVTTAGGIAGGFIGRVSEGTNVITECSSSGNVTYNAGDPTIIAHYAYGTTDTYTAPTADSGNSMAHYSYASGFIGSACGVVQIDNCNTTSDVYNSSGTDMLGDDGSMIGVAFNSSSGVGNIQINYAYVDSNITDLIGVDQVTGSGTLTTSTVIDSNDIDTSVVSPVISTTETLDASAQEWRNLFDDIMAQGGAYDLSDANPYELNSHRDDSEWITNLINEGYAYLYKKDKDGNEYQVSVATDTGLQEVSDEKDLRKAEAKYEADMRKIDAKDKKYDTELAAIDNERNAVKAEMETLKTVAKDNVERTFKLFS